MSPRDLKPSERIILPIDISNVNEAIKLVEKLSPYVGVFKIGFEAIYSTMADLFLENDIGASFLLNRVRFMARKITAQKTFLDVKLADIPNTVEKAVKAIARLKPRMFNIHTSAGAKVISAASANKGESLLFGVTVLTSIGEDECFSIFGDSPEVKVLEFAKMLVDGGADGIICAPKEGLILRKNYFFDKMIIATPNVRPLWSANKDDQNKERQMTPCEAIKAGIDMIVIGRPILNPPAQIGDSIEAAKAIAEEIENALGDIEDKEVFFMGPNGIRRNNT
ncbi:MAG: orotidine-5'-phosphate decarboxylase [Patescibacteria group bacterium]